MLSESCDEHRVGHDEPDGEEESHPQVWDEHVSGVDDGEQEHPNAGDELSQDIEDEDGACEQERDEDRGGSKDHGAEDREHEGCGDHADGEFDGCRSIDDGGPGLAKGAIAMDIEEIVETCSKGVEAYACDESSGEQDPKGVFFDGWGADFFDVESVPEDDEPEVGDCPKRGGDACKFEHGCEFDEQSSHWGSRIGDCGGCGED